MELDKKRNHHCLLFCFHQRKNADAHRFVKRMVKMLWNVCEIDLNNLKTMISISMTKNATPYSYERRQIAKRWKKIMKNLDGKYFD